MQNGAHELFTQSQRASIYGFGVEVLARVNVLLCSTVQASCSTGWAGIDEVKKQVER